MRTFTNINGRAIQTTDVITIVSADGDMFKYKWADVESFIESNIDTITGNLAISGTLGVTGATTLTGALTANGGVTIPTTKDLTLGADSDITVNTDKFTVTGKTGNTAIGGTLAVTGATTLSDILSTKAVLRNSSVKTAAYEPSELTDDYILVFSGLSAGVAYTISEEDRDSGSVTSAREIIIKNADSTYNVTVALETSGTIDGETNIVLTPRESVTLLLDGTNAHII